MKKIYTLIIMLLYVPALMAQGNEVDAYLLGNRELNGTARSMSMGGAFGALGGNISVLSSNPAGLGIFRSCDASLTLDLSTNTSTTDWSGTKSTNRKTNFTPSHAGGVLYCPTDAGGILNCNIGVSMSRAKNFNRNYTMESTRMPSSMGDYVAYRATNAFGNSGIALDAIDYDRAPIDPYNNSLLSGQWLSILGYESWMISPQNENDGNNDIYHSSFGNPHTSLLTVTEAGGIYEADFGLAINISNILFLGTSLSVTEIDYRMNSMFENLFDKYSGATKDDHLYLKNQLTTEGEGYAGNFGAILNLQFLRLGIAYNTPSYYKMTDYYTAFAGTYLGNQALQNNSPKDRETPENQYSEYSYKTPGKVTFSGALLFGQTALISADYEISDYSKMRFADRKGNERGFNQNDFIKDDFSRQQTLKLGAELKPTLQFAARLGLMTQTTPMRKQLVNNEVEVLPAGTVTHFTTSDRPVTYYTAGLGYRFTPNFYADIACVYRFQDLNAYAFSNTYNSDPQFGITPIKSIPATLNDKKFNVVMTIGVKL
ncbi:MAG: hypothetical protein LBD53_06495 [Tannerella sp.]|nr:hypothetical protein [Tannerella sp.]